MENINSFASLKNICCKRSSSFLFSFLILLLFLLSLNCNHSTPPNNDNSSITITAEDASCIEAWLNVKLNNITLPQQFNLFENDSLKTNLILLSNDTTIFVEGLLPKRNYRYKLTYTKSSGAEKSSNEITVETLDTTSHNFTWQTFTFGQHSSSTLYDVAIIDENNIWAVGEIYMNDSLGNPDPHAYNAVHWDGSVWTVKKITVLYKGSLITPTMYSVFAFAPTEIWMSSGVPVKGDGNTWTQYHLFDMGILTQKDGYLTKIWGNSSNDIYFVGTLGTIAHWDGVNWRKIESPAGTSGTSLNINDIWGDFNEKTGEWEILAVAATYFTQPPTNIYKITKTKTKIISTSGIYTTSWGIWHKSHRSYFIVGGGNYNRRNIENNSFWLPMNELNQIYFCRAIRGTGFNDIVIVGDFGILYHYNGISWISYPELIGNQSFYSVEKKREILATVGFKGAQASILIGRITR